MDSEYGIVLGVLGALLAFVVVLSYLGAYFLGKSRGRRDAERRHKQDEQRVVNAVSSNAAERVQAVELAVEALAKAVERMTDAQRVALLQSRATLDPRNGSRGVSGSTPAAPT